MRPNELFPLFALLTSLPSMGEVMAKRVERLLAGAHVVDLLWHRPSAIVDRRPMPGAAHAISGQVATFVVKVLAYHAPAAPRRPWRISTSDDTGPLDLVFFHTSRSGLEQRLPIGSQLAISGLVENFAGTAQIIHPDHVVPATKLDKIRQVEPVYPLADGISSGRLQKWVSHALARAPDLAEWIDPAQLQQNGWPSWRTALEQLHCPANSHDLSQATPARRRLAYDELLANQLALQLIRRAHRQRKGQAVCGDGSLTDTVRAILPFHLTDAQTRADAEITADQVSSQPMLRLLQGDVGSGKTIVAFLAMLRAIEAGHQAVLMAPTEILARQHLGQLAGWAAAAGIETAALTSRDKGRARAALLARLANGELKLVVGTHALFQDDVVFANPGLVVIDEQHRFGVDQRLTLSSKGKGVDVLVMTATPIPRTLALAAHGDMDITILDGKPPGRQPITTVAIPSNRLEEVIASLERKLAGGERAYWICPRVEDSEETEIAAVLARHDELKARLGERVGLVHGRMRAAEKDQVMAAFADGSINLLVATTVVEVGVDVPEATVIVIESAERFGLAQLHQLRGRVGRGIRPSTCILLYEPPLSGNARRRLEILRETGDGFRIAEEDLRLRGAGDLLGTRQSGLPDFRLASLETDGDLVAMAQADARQVLQNDPALESARGAALRTLLYLFSRDMAVRYLRSG